MPNGGLIEYVDEYEREPQPLRHRCYSTHAVARGWLPISALDRGTLTRVSLHLLNDGAAVATSRAYRARRRCLAHELDADPRGRCPALAAPACSG
jgi:hypothetical protein